MMPGNLQIINLSRKPAEVDAKTKAEMQQRINELERRLLVLAPASHPPRSPEP